MRTLNAKEALWAYWETMQEASLEVRIQSANLLLAERVDVAMNAAVAVEVVGAVKIAVAAVEHVGAVKIAVAAVENADAAMIVAVSEE